jgi:glycogen debranching enzyme
VARTWNDDNTPLVANLREGPWLMEYFVARTRAEAARDGGAPLAPVADWLSAHYGRAASAPPLLRPQAFARVTAAALRAAYAAALARMPGPLLSGAAERYAAGCARNPLAPPPLHAALALTSVALYGAVPSAPALGAALPPPLAHVAPSLAAGFPHFATGYMRCWGRDTFISLRGLLLATGRWGDARAALLAGGALLRHGLLPNLLDGGARPRYNCRDAVWWWARAVQDYCAMAPEGDAFLQAPCPRRWHSDAEGDYEAPPGGGPLRPRAPPPAAAAVPTVADALVAALRAHGAGIDFLEWGAEREPRALDAHMAPSGFRVRAWVDPATGFVHGGSPSNCGTWMDKMGSVAGVNEGEPATPRDGAAVEITALLFATLSWMGSLPAGALPAAGVPLAPGAPPTAWGEWAARVGASFERAYYVPSAPGEDGGFDVAAAWVHRRGMYKDTVGSAAGWSDYQLRPNALVAMAVAPALFTPARAAAALACSERQLLGEAQLGVKTLDPGDWAFRGVYAAGAGGERRVAGGWNYHQGPEWLWPYGAYLRARLRFPPPPLAAPGGTGWRSGVERRRWLLAALARHRAHLEEAPEGALPELTQAGGARCDDSCTAQAWSGATILDALEDLRAMEAAEASALRSGAGAGPLSF